MGWVAFDLDRAAVVAGHEEAGGGTGKLERGRIAQRASRDVPFRKVRERDDRLLRPAAAGRHPGERDRGPHQPEEIAPGGGEHLVGVGGELALDQLPERRVRRPVVEAAPHRAVRGAARALFV